MLTNLKLRLYLSLTPDEFDCTLGRWALLIGGLLWLTLGSYWLGRDGWGPPFVLVVGGLIAAPTGVYASRSAWRKGLL